MTRAIQPHSAVIIPSLEGGRQTSALAAEDDAQLLERIGKGEKAAFAVLVRRHSGRFYRVAYRFVGNVGEAEDMVQEAFLKLWERPLMWQVDRRASFSTWFYRVVVNLCLDHKKKKRPALIGDDKWVEDDRETHEETLIHAETQHWIAANIAALPDRQRMALNLCFYEGLSNQEAAEAMGIRLKALQSLLMRAKTTLKEAFKDSIGD